MKIFVKTLGAGLLTWAGVINLAHAAESDLREWSLSAFGPGHAAQSSSANPSAASAAPSVDALLSVTHPPFSFLYDGKPSSVLLPTWKQEEKPDAGVKTVKWTDPATGLVVEAKVTVYPDFPAVEWVLNFTNTGDKDTPILENVQALDETLQSTPATQPVILRQIAGSNANETDFVPSQKEIAPGQAISFNPSSGRSSDQTFPFFNLQSGDGGVIVAIGWSGQWLAQLKRASSGETQVVAGMDVTHLRLHPGESIRTPSILLLRWSGGDWIDGQNQFRRLLVAHYIPRLNGKPVQCCIAAQSFNHGIWGVKGWGTEAGQIASAKINKELGCDTLWLDAGWFDGGFQDGVGNWTVDAQKFPHGLKPIADACHALGLKWLLWWDPEAVSPNTRIQKEHPDFVIGRGLFNLGNPKALAWMTNMLNQQITDFGVDCFRTDLTVQPGYNWGNNEGADRLGMSQIRYIEGLYSMWDSIRREHPNLYIDDCASGGRRIDLETLKRAVVQTRSDSVGAADRNDWDQSQAYGLSLYVPDHATIGWNTTAYGTRSSATSGFCAEWSILDPRFPMDQAKAAIAEIKANQPYWYADYYPLTPWTLATEQWMAYQFNRPENGDGIVLAFRHETCPIGTLTVELRGLKPEQNYTVTFSDESRHETSTTMTGKDLSQLKLAVATSPGSLLVRYQAVR